MATRVKKPEPFPGTVVKKIREKKVDGMPLGRHINHDPRSLRYQVKPRASLAVSKKWTRETPILDQGNLGSCTGNAATGALGTDPFYATVQPLGVSLDENEAVKLYSAATALDSYPGVYPPQDTGSDGLSVAKAAQQAGLISGYLHCMSIDAVVTALQTGPVITGVNWYDSFDTPDPSGFVKLAANAQVRGGHEFLIYGVDVDLKLLYADNSWGTGWGLNGTFCFGFDDYTRLLSEQGDATQFVPLVASPTPTPPTPPGPNPPPTPTPTPPTPNPPTPTPLVPNEADVLFAQHVGTACARTRPFKTWKAALGL